jgi:hypothetical protein
MKLANQPGPSGIHLAIIEGKYMLQLIDQQELDL